MKVDSCNLLFCQPDSAEKHSKGGVDEAVRILR